jgi:hypothetical protein
MATPSVPDPIEMCAIHLAVCRYRRQGLVCSTCYRLAERAKRAAAGTTPAGRATRNP